MVVNLDGRAEHSIIQQGIKVLVNLLHRGATGADIHTGDGAGILIQMPDAFFRGEAARESIVLPPSGSYGVGMLFLPQSQKLRDECRKKIGRIVAEEGLEVLHWRTVPVDPSAVGESARAEMPAVQQVIVADAHGKLKGIDLERKLYVIRKRLENESDLPVDGSESFYACSFSCRTIVYKGMMSAQQVPILYADLNDERMTSAVAIVHQRYSTNTFPSWSLAQPFRMLAHNGEINTLRGNRNWMRARERNLRSEIFGEEDIRKIVPVIQESGSDSACLDNVLELLTLGGRDIYHSMMMLMPQAWGSRYPIGPDLHGFFEFHAGIMEPWDGPAAVAFTDGRYVCAALDRNGLRPARYTITRSGFLVLASEAGVLDIPAEDVLERGALRPGQIMVADLETGALLHDKEVKMKVARRQPYRRWVEKNRIAIHGFYNAVGNLKARPAEDLLVRQRLFGYTREDTNTILDSMASSGAEPVGSMGADQPLAVLSEKPQLLYWYFKQLFAQITNPPIDSIREELVMSLMTFIGISDDILNETPAHARLLKLRHPILSDEDLQRVRSLQYSDYQSEILSIGYVPDEKNPGKALEEALENLCTQAEKILRSGKRILILSDRELASNEAPIPALLAVSSVNQHLVNCALRTDRGILVETGEAREVMHMALLLGYGASAICPWLAYESIASMAESSELSAKLGAAKAIENYIKALRKGLLKVMSKMGISTLRSYRNAQIFEAVGLSSDFVNRYFPGTASRVGGIGIDGVAREVQLRWKNAVPKQYPANLPVGGQYQLFTTGERHLWTASTITLLQEACRNNDLSTYRRYAELINNQKDAPSTLRGLFTMKPAGDPVPLEEVEPAEDIMKRFVTGAMSFGSLSREAHETLAIAMNRLGAASNSGEGGEDPIRYKRLPNGDSRRSEIKQIASGRFGVTAEYLVNARELQIKIAQGAKPGEGGQLPGHKVDEEIARVRHSTPGVTLISPPPHHDIYSIEDIAQLIYDLRNANDAARVSVKLVSELGVGTIAAGVAKARADMILIAGGDGGTGASPLSSIKHAGAPWEIGLAETQQTLVLNGLRSRVRLQADGQMKTGRDIVIAALLGAEEFGFATGPLVVTGCLMMRKCHTNECPVGVATQDPELRKRFTGKPEHVINFFRFIAGEVRERMASLGFRKMDEMIGRVDLLGTEAAESIWKAHGLDFSKIFHRVEADPSEIRKSIPQSTTLEEALDYKLLKEIEPAINEARSITVKSPIRNVNRTAGTLISSRIARKYGHDGLPEDSVTVEFTGTAGQSFGAFAAAGLTLKLEGEANDYLGKGLSGGKLIVHPSKKSSIDPSKNIIAGNVLLYGAISGEVYLNGRAGERFAIRNSGAKVVVEGVGDHGCEYMTGGRVVVLGPTGVNFGAGMSGGIAYVLDEDGNFDNNCNLDTIDLEVLDEEDSAELRELLEKHHRYTGSPKAGELLADWPHALTQFVKVFPMEYRQALAKKPIPEPNTGVELENMEKE